MRWIVAGGLVFVLTGSRCADSPLPPDALETVRGTLTTEGVECQALRSTTGVLYTLTGNLGEFRAGDQVCVKGRRAEVSICQQGITLVVEWIGKSCPD